MIVSTNIISTIAGSGAVGFGSGSYSGDGGSATSATMYYPAGLALDLSGSFCFIYLFLVSH